MRWTHIVFIVLTVWINGYLGADTLHPCADLETCSACTQNPECAWCSQSYFLGDDKKALPRCNSIEAHEQLGNFKCETKHLFRHYNKLVIVRDVSSGKKGSKEVPLFSPQELSLKLRVQDPVVFDMKYQEAKDYPLDLYYLMDGTHSMTDDKKVLISLGDSIGQKLRSLTSQFRQGFGTFVDKVTMPFVLTTSKFNSPCEGCVPPYGFQNRMQLSNDTKQFSDAVESMDISGSSDLPEGGFDALMQVLVCEDAIGWSERPRRLVIFAADARYHLAGDGRLGGMILPNDGKCHMDENGYYTHSLVSDYPSFALLNAKARGKFNIIFAVTKDEIEDYKKLESMIEGSRTTELAKDSANIVDLVEQRYNEIKSKVEIKDSFQSPEYSEFFKVTYYSKCQHNSSEVEGSTCEGLEAGSVVQFRVKIELIKCPDDRKKWKDKHTIYAVGVYDKIEIDVEALCDCPCEAPEQSTPNSPLCNSKGSENCGICNCNANYWGDNCQCSSADNRPGENSACKQENSTELCSGRGTCYCGKCSCNEDRYTGKFCECDNNNCHLANGVLCADHGKCVCGTCACDPEWSGPGCDCSTDMSSCVEPGSSEECSGKGKCGCGKCQCEGKYSGEYCEKCLHETCPNRCEELKHCVLCKVHGTGVLNPADCELQCYQHSITPVDFISPTTGVATNEFPCKGLDPSDECVFEFNYLTTRDKKIKIAALKEKECPMEAPIFWIVVAGASIVVVIGLIFLCVYQTYTNLQVKREFSKYEKERSAVAWGREVNPIYNNPVGEFSNPTYAGNN